MSKHNKTKQRRRKNRKARMLDERLARATGVTTTTLKTSSPDYEGATGVVPEGPHCPPNNEV